MVAIWRSEVDSDIWRVLSSARQEVSSSPSPLVAKWLSLGNPMHLAPTGRAPGLPVVFKERTHAEERVFTVQRAPLPVFLIPPSIPRAVFQPGLKWPGRACHNTTRFVLLKIIFTAWFLFFHPHLLSRSCWWEVVVQRSGVQKGSRSGLSCPLFPFGWSFPSRPLSLTFLKKEGTAESLFSLKFTTFYLSHWIGNFRLYPKFQISNFGKLIFGTVGTILYSPRPYK